MKSILFKKQKLENFYKISLGIAITILVISNIMVYNSLRFKIKLSIYRNYCYKHAISSNIIPPIKYIKVDDFEDTYGAPRPGGRKHQGIDLFCDYGTELLVVIDGNIVYKGNDNLGGKVIYLLGNDNRLYYYAHLSEFADIKVNQKVKQGDVIGYAGKSGNAINTPCHLHFEVMVIKWLFPYIYGNINPYSILVDAINNS